MEDDINKDPVEFQKDKLLLKNDSADMKYILENKDLLAYDSLKLTE